MKAVDGYDKLRGGYYTPEDIASFIVRWAVRNPDDTVLEPSCGDGSFLSAIQRAGRISTGNITGIELDSVEAC